MQTSHNEFGSVKTSIIAELEGDKKVISERKHQARIQKMLRMFLEVLPPEHEEVLYEKFAKTEGTPRANKVVMEVLSLAIGTGTTVVNGQPLSTEEVPAEIRGPIQGLVVESYHRELWKWHHDNFFRFEDNLLEEEIQYIQECFRWAGLEHYDTHIRPKDRLSYFSYSHRVKGAKVNSSRFAIGLVKNPQRVVGHAKRVMEARRVTSFGNYTLTEHQSIFDDPNLIFGGIGWDIEEGQIKVYFRAMNISALPVEMHPGNSDGGDRGDYELASLSGIVSWTYNMAHSEGSATGGAHLHEEKVYLMARLPSPLNPNELVNVTVMAASKRGDVLQYDIKDPLNVVSNGNAGQEEDALKERGNGGYHTHLSYWKDKINRTGLDIIFMYSDNDEPLDTIAFKEKDDFTLYFP